MQLADLEPVAVVVAPLDVGELTVAVGAAVRVDRQVVVAGGDVAEVDPATLDDRVRVGQAVDRLTVGGGLADGEGVVPGVLAVEVQVPAVAGEGGGARGVARVFGIQALGAHVVVELQLQGAVDEGGVVLAPGLRVGAGLRRDLPRLVDLDLAVDRYRADPAGLAGELDAVDVQAAPEAVDRQLRDVADDLEPVRVVLSLDRLAAAGGLDRERHGVDRGLHHVVVVAGRVVVVADGVDSVGPAGRQEEDGAQERREQEQAITHHGESVSVPQRGGKCRVPRGRCKGCRGHVAFRRFRQ